MSFSKNIKALKSIYEKAGIARNFKKDSKYLKEAYNEIHKFWLHNFKAINKVNYLMIAEAPLWGKEKKYIYNPNTNNTQFFYRSDLEGVFGLSIKNKNEFISKCNEIGLLVVDISPFPLNKNVTKINYRKMKRSVYLQLVSATIPTFFAKYIKKVRRKKSTTIKVFFRYGIERSVFQNIISKVLIDENIIRDKSEIGEISQRGGGIDKLKFSQIVKANY